MSIERCLFCDEPTGRAGEGNDSLFDDQGEGPYCEECWDEYEARISQEEHEFQIARQREWDNLISEQRNSRIRDAGR